MSDTFSSLLQMTLAVILFLLASSMANASTIRKPVTTPPDPLPAWAVARAGAGLPPG